MFDDFQNSQIENGGNGIEYERPTLVENNLVYSNGGHGIHAFQSNNLEIRNNTTVGNGLVLDDGA